MNRSEYYDAQRSVIGSMLIDGEHVAGIVMHRSREEDYTGEYKTLFRACRELFQAGKPVDPVVVKDKAGPQYAPVRPSAGGAHGGDSHRSQRGGLLGPPGGAV